MSPFRWPKVEHDIALCKEVVSIRPKNPEEWENVAYILSVIFSTDKNPVSLKGRSCREHLELLLKKFEANERIALKRSGTEEHYDELAQLLEDISSFLKDMQTIKEANAKKISSKEKADQQKGLEIRKAAMETYNKRKQDVLLVNSDIEEELSDDGGTVSSSIKPKGSLKKNKKCRASQSNMLEYLSEKHNDTLKIKEKQLALEERKMELEEKKIALEQKKWELLLSQIEFKK